MPVDREGKVIKTKKPGTMEEEADIGFIDILIGGSSSPTVKETKPKPKKKRSKKR